MNISTPPALRSPKAQIKAPKGSCKWHQPWIINQRDVNCHSKWSTEHANSNVHFASDGLQRKIDIDKVSAILFLFSSSSSCPRYNNEKLWYQSASKQGPELTASLWQGQTMNYTYIVPDFKEVKRIGLGLWNLSRNHLVRIYIIYFNWITPANM